MVKKGLPPEVKPGQDVALDLELYGAERDRLHRPTGTFACLSVATDAGTWMITDEHDVAPLVERVKNGLWIMHNATFDLRQLERWARLPKPRVWDTMLVDQDLWGGYYTTFGLEDAVRRWLGEYMDKGPRDLFEKNKKMSPEMKQYAIGDVVKALEIKRQQAAWLKDNDEPLRTYFECDEPMIWAVLAMPPVRVDVDSWMAFAATNEEMAAKLEGDLGFNVKSPKQVLEVLRKAGFKNVKDTSEETLKTCAVRASNKKQKDLVDAIMNVRMYRDAVSKYGAKWIEKNVEEGGLVYANWRIVGAETGRMSCRSPNLQQIPSRELPIYRSFFVAGPGKRLIVADVSQQEPRVAAWMSHDPQLVDDVLTGDVYAPIADAFGIDRITAKTIFLGVTYGLSAFGLASRMNIPKDEAQKFITAIMRRYRTHAAWIGRQRATANRLGFVRTSMGRRVWLNTYNYQWENNAINAPIQGSAAEQTKLAVGKMLLTMPEFCVTMVVHDEVVAEVPTKEVAKYKKFIKDCWEWAGEIVTPGMPVAVGMGHGVNWKEAK